MTDTPAEPLSAEDLRDLVMGARRYRGTLAKITDGDWQVILAATRESAGLDAEPIRDGEAYALDTERSVIPHSLVEQAIDATIGLSRPSHRESAGAGLDRTSWAAGVEDGLRSLKRGAGLDVELLAAFRCNPGHQSRRSGACGRCLAKAQTFLAAARLPAEGETA